ncbi:MAG TPA: hypothetical protein VLV83_26180 [Acidobacteriota bacterium]|nr:hypothetical protein [Acidobacteriota bacterium]
MSTSSHQKDSDGQGRHAEGRRDVDSAAQEPVRRQVRRPHAGGQGLGVFAAYRWPVALVVVALLLLVAYLVTFAGFRQSGQDALQAAADIASRFRSGRITETVRSGLPTITSTPGGNLEVATITQLEILTRENEQRIFWDAVSLGTSVSEIRLDATYRYHVRMDAHWQIDVSGQVCIVRAPPLQPSLPPAFDSASVEKHTQAGWLRFDAQQQLDQLERDITSLLSTKAADPGHLNLAREEARKTIAQFVHRFLVQEDHWGPTRFRAIIVTFPDEQPATAPYHLGTALTLESPTSPPENK